MKMELLARERRQLDLLQNGTEIGKLLLLSRWSEKASIHLADTQVEIVPEKWWNSRFLLLKNDQEIGSLRLKWSGQSEISWPDENGRRQIWTLTQKGIFQHRFILTDAHGSTLLTLKCRTKWVSLRNEFEIELTNKYRTQNTSIAGWLILIAAYAAEQYLPRLATA